MDLGSVDVANILLTIVGFLIVYTLNGIKKEITEVKSSVVQLSENLTNIDKRVLVLETLKEQTNGHLYAKKIGFE